MIDVLPDEASLAMVLTHELAHIVLGHHLNTKLAFNDGCFSLMSGPSADGFSAGQNRGRGG